MTYRYVKSLLRRPVWALEKACLHGRSWKRLNREDIFLAVFPKTGSTWVRFFLFNLLCRTENKDFPRTIDEMDRVMPEFGHSSMFTEWPFKSCPRLVKNHHPANFMTRRNRAILLIRDPRDVAVSYYHYINGSASSGKAISLKEIIHDPVRGFEGFFRQYYSWRERALQIIQFEELRRNPSQEFGRLTEALGIASSREDILYAIEQSDLASMRKAQSRSENMQKRLKDGFQFARKGGTGEWKTMLDKEDIDYWNRLSHKYEFTLYS